MKPLLLDSNDYLWLLYESNRLGPKTLKRLQAADTVYVSAACLWELAIKHDKGRLPYSAGELAKGMDALGAELLPIETRHLENLRNIKLPHKDPFDRLLVAQSEAGNCIFITSDKNILQSKYPARDVSE